MALLDPITITITRSDNAAKSFSGRPSNSEPFGITELIGFEFPEVEVFTQPRGLGDGVFFTGQRLNGRTVEIHLKQNERYPQDFFDGWNALKSFFNPALTFTVSVDNETSGVTVTRQLNDCRILAADYHMINAGEPNPELIVQMMSSGPLFEGVPQTVNYSGLTDQVHKTITNGGDSPARFSVTLTCTNAGTNTNFIGVVVEDVGLRIMKRDVSAFAVNDEVFIDVENGAYTVNGVTARATQSELPEAFTNWFLQVGGNDFYIGDGEAGTAWNVVVEWREAYLGI